MNKSLNKNALKLNKRPLNLKGYIVLSDGSCWKSSTITRPYGFKRERDWKSSNKWEKR